MRISKRGLWFTAALAICGYFGFYTELADNAWALVGMIFFLLVLHEVLWGQETAALNRRGQGRIEYIIPERGLRRIPEATVYKTIGQSVASKGGTNTPTESPSSDGRTSSK